MAAISAAAGTPLEATTHLTEWLPALDVDLEPPTHEFPQELADGAPVPGQTVTLPPMPPPLIMFPETDSAPPSEDADDPSAAIAEDRDRPIDSELGVLRIRDPRQDPELGVLRLRPLPPTPEPRPYLFLSGYFSAISSDNIFLVDDPVLGRVGDNFLRPGISLIAFPALGPQTNLLASAEVNLLRYAKFPTADYDELRVQVGVRHSFTNRIYGQLLWNHQQLYRPSFRERFFSRHGIELFIGRRDPLSSKLTLDTYYQGQIYFSNPADFSNVVQSVGTYLNYEFTPQWRVGVGYQLTLADFTQVSRTETYQRVLGQLTYSVTPSVRFNLFGGMSFGRSSAPQITFDDTFFGISVDATLELF